MEPLIHLDTHVVAILYSGELKGVSKKVIDILNYQPLCISEIVRLELQYLFEIKIISQKPDEIISILQKDFALVSSTNSQSEIISQAINLDFTRDPFDRIIVADAMLNDSILITKDQTILDFYDKALW